MKTTHQPNPQSISSIHLIISMANLLEETPLSDADKQQISCIRQLAIHLAAISVSPVDFNESSVMQFE